MQEQLHLFDPQDEGQDIFTRLIQALVNPPYEFERLMRTLDELEKHKTKRLPRADGRLKQRTNQ